MKDERYFKMYDMTLLDKIVNSILDMMKEIRPFDRKIDPKDINRFLQVIECNCADGGLFDEDACDGHYDFKLTPNMLYIDYMAEKKEKARIIAHELIHYMQHKMYLMFNIFEEKEVLYDVCDDVTDDMLDDWYEQMASKMECSVMKLLVANKVKLKARPENEKQITVMIERESMDNCLGEMKEDE